MGKRGLQHASHQDADRYRRRGLGFEAGGDLQHDLNNKLGLFLSYRKGNYDMNGDGKHHYSTIGSEIDIDSYLAGLYYRYDRNHWWTFATVYGGIQRG